MDQKSFFDNLTTSLDSALQSPTRMARLNALRLVAGAAGVALLAGKSATEVAEASAKKKSKKKKKARNERLRARSIGNVSRNAVRSVGEAEPGNPGDRCNPGGCANNLNCTAGGSDTCYIPPDQVGNQCSGNQGKPCGANGTGSCSGDTCSGGGGDDGWCGANGGSCKCGCNEAANCCNECPVCPDHCECGCVGNTTTCKSNCGGSGCTPNPHVCEGGKCGPQFDGCNTVNCGECPVDFCKTPAGQACDCGCDEDRNCCDVCPPENKCANIICQNGCICDSATGQCPSACMQCPAGWKFDPVKGQCRRGAHCDCPGNVNFCIDPRCPGTGACQIFSNDTHAGTDRHVCVFSKDKRKGNGHGGKKKGKKKKN